MVKKEHNTVILGAGPAGVQLAYHLQKSGDDYLLLERAEQAGAFFAKLPRQRRLLSINKVHTGRSEPEFNMRHDWNSLLTETGEEFPFSRYSQDYFPHADALVEYLNDYTKEFSLRVQYGANVVSVDKDPTSGRFTISTEGGDTFECRRLVVASGLSKPYVPDIPGIELVEGYESVSIDREDFAGQTVLILGKGNSALEIANHLLAHASVIHLSSPRSIRFAWDSHFVGHVRSVNAVFMDSYLLKSQNGVLDGTTKEIRKNADGKFVVRWSSQHTDVEEEIEQMEYDRVIRCTGFRFDDSIFSDRCKPDLTCGDRLPAITGGWESTNVENMFFAGSLTQSLDWKKAQSSFIHGFRHNVKSLAALFRARDNRVDLPARDVPIEASILASRILERANVTCALWQQVDFMCDVIDLPKGGGSVGRWYHDLNFHYVVESDWGSNPSSDYYTIAMTYGPCPEDSTVFNHAHVHRPACESVHGDLTTEIHPVIRRMRGNQVLTEYHVRTDFVTDWASDFYLQPLTEFFERDLVGQTPEPRAKPRRRELIRNSEMRFKAVLVDGAPLASGTG